MAQASESVLQQKTNYNFLLQLFSFLILNFALISSTLFDQLKVNEGLGWDGIHYADVTRNFIQHLSLRNLNAYKIQRIFPCGIIYCILKVLGLQFSNANIVRAFSIYNIVLVNLSLFFWFRILKLFFFSHRTVVASTVLLLVNFCILKFSMFYPVLTDVTSFFLGMILLYAYLKDKMAALLVIGLVCAFTHPLLQYFSILLFLFPRKTEKIAPVSFPILRYLPYICCLVYAGTILFLYVKRPDLIDIHLFQNTNPVNRHLLFLSMLCAACYLFTVSKSMLRYQLIERGLSQLRPWRIFLALLILAVSFSIRSLLSNKVPAFGINSVVVNILNQSVSNPFLFMVAHVIFFGVAVLLIVLYFKSYEKYIAKIGLGFSACMYIVLFMGIGSESRQFSFAFPFLMLPLAFVLERELMNRAVPYLVFSSLLLSKVWMPLDVGVYTGKPLSFPDQYFFMSLGPWMIPSVFILNAAVVLALGGFYFAFYYKKQDIPSVSGEMNLKLNPHAEA